MYKYDKTYTPVVNPNPMDNIANRSLPLHLVTHQVAKKFFVTSYNMPWIKNPVCYIESDGTNDVYNSKDMLYVVVDSYDTPTTTSAQIVYIKRPNPFVKNLSENPSSYESFFDWGDSQQVPEAYIFELNDTVAEELVSLAVSFALENVESPRLNSKLNMRGLEA